MSNGEPIIIKGGGSIAIEFNESHYSGNDGKYYSPHSKIVSVEVINDATGHVQKVDIPADGKCTVRINTR